MAKQLREGQAVTVPNPDGPGWVPATYAGREEDDVKFDASTQVPHDWQWVQYSEGEGEGLTGLYSRRDIVPVDDDE